MLDIFIHVVKILVIFLVTALGSFSYAYSATEGKFKYRDALSYMMLFAMMLFIYLLVLIPLGSWEVIITKVFSIVFFISIFFSIYVAFLILKSNSIIRMSNVSALTYFLLYWVFRGPVLLKEGDPLSFEMIVFAYPIAIYTFATLISFLPKTERYTSVLELISYVGVTSGLFVITLMYSFKSLFEWSIPESPTELHYFIGLWVAYSSSALITKSVSMLASLYYMGASGSANELELARQRVDAAFHRYKITRSYTTMPITKTAALVLILIPLVFLGFVHFTNLPLIFILFIVAGVLETLDHRVFRHMG